MLTLASNTEANRSERERSFSSEKKSAEGGDAVLRIEKGRHIIYQDRTKRMQFKSNKHHTTYNYC
jgi:hypothetical protein